MLVQIMTERYLAFFFQTIETINQENRETKIILDIDLDYFSCAGNPNELEEIYIEITKGEYNTFQSNRYHRLNYCGFGKIEAIQKNKKSFYKINDYKEIYPSHLKVDEAEIITRIDKFTNTLINKKIVPLIISICRSSYSGYTAKEQVNFIMDNLLFKLSGVFELNKVSLIENAK